MDCSICGKRDFASRASLDLHRSRKHSVRTWGCPECSNKYVAKKWLRRHMLKAHGHELDLPSSSTTPQFTNETRSIGEFAEQQTLRNKVPYPEAEGVYSMTEYRNSLQKTTRIRYASLGVKFNEKLNLVPAPQNFLLFSQAFHNIMHREIKRLSARSQDFVQWSFFHPGLEFPISVPLTKIAHSSVAVLLDAIDRVLQSQKELKIDSEIKLDFAYVPMPRIGTISRNILHRTTLELEEYLRGMRSVVCVPEVRNGQCFAYALAAAARNRIPGSNKRTWLWFFVSNVAKNWVEQFIETTGVAPKDGPWTPEQCKTMSQKFFEIYDIPVHCFELDSAQSTWKKLWLTGTGDVHVHILIHSNHAYYCKSLTSLIGHQSQYCNTCGIVPRRLHFCDATSNSCKYCKQPGCVSEPDSETKFPRFQCHICRKSFVLESCLDYHNANNSCVPKGKLFCAKCHRTDVVNSFDNEKVHKIEFCGFSFCRLCNKRMPDTHKYHFMYPIKKGRQLRTRFYYFDVEARTQDRSDGEHVFVLVCLQDQEGNELMFRGEDSIDKFMTYVFNLKPETGEKIVLIAHNYSAYDSMGVLAWIYSRNLDPKIIFRGQSVYNLKFRNKRIEFKDSYLFVPAALSSFNKLFQLEESKTHFPHKFHTLKNENYVGPLPAQHYYSPETMRPSRSKEFVRWWEQEQQRVGDTWSLQATLEEYCSTDVTVLRQGCISFGESFRRIAGFNPLETSITISGATMRAYKLNFLPSNSIVQCSDLGLQPEGRHSRIACTYIAWLEHLDTVEISSSLRGKEVNVMRWRVDGYLETTKNLPNILPNAQKDGQLKKIVIEYYGCQFHGVCSCTKPDQVHPFTKESMDVCRGKTLRKISTLRAAGYYVVTKNDCDFRKEIAENRELKRFVEKMDGLVEPIKPRDALYGGRTNCVKLHYTPADDEELVWCDFVSMYPFLLHSHTLYPCGEPEVRRFGLDDVDVQDVFGLIKCSVLPPEQLFMPVLPVKIKGKLVFGLCMSCMKADPPTTTYKCSHSNEERTLKEQTWVSEELKLAIKYNYKVVKVFEVWHWKQWSNTLFRSFMMKFYEEKLKASGVPAGLDRDQFVADCNEKYGLQLKPEDIMDNPPKKQTAKLGLNNFWGKFGERNIHTENKLVRGFGDILSILLDNNLESQQVFRVGADLSLVTWKRKEENLKPIANSSIIPAIWTTAAGRILLFEKIFAKLSDPVSQLCYFDTDGCVFVQKKASPEIPLHAGFLGGLASELKPGEVMKRFMSSGPKSWGFQLEKNDGTLEWVMKNKGIKLTNESLRCLPIEEVWKTVLEMDMTPKLIVDSNKMKRNRIKGAVFSSTEFKQWRINITKRIVCDDQQNTLPFGYERVGATSKRACDDPDTDKFFAPLCKYVKC